MTEIIEAPVEPTKVAQTPASGSEPTAWMSDTGEIREGAPEAVANLVKTKGWDTVEKIVEGFVGLEKFKGVGKHLVIPEPEDTEGWDNIYNEMGRPPTYDKYEFTNESGIELSEELMTGFKQFAHKEGYTQKQMEGAVKFQLDAVLASAEVEKTILAEREETNIRAMKDKWGVSNYDTTFKRVEGMAEKLGVLEFLRTRGIDKEPEIVNMLITLSNSDAEDDIIPSTATATTKTAQERIDEIKKDEAFLGKFHPKHKEIMIEYMRLNQEVANAGQARQPRI